MRFRFPVFSFARGWVVAGAVWVRVLGLLVVSGEQRRVAQGRKIGV